MKQHRVETPKTDTKRPRPDMPKVASRPDISPHNLHHLQRTIGNQAVGRLLAAGKEAGTPPIQRKIHARYERMWTWAKNENLLDEEGVQKIRKHVAPLKGSADTAILNLVSLSNWTNKSKDPNEQNTKRYRQALIWKKLLESNWNLNEASLMREQVREAPTLVTSENDTQIRDEVKQKFNLQIYQEAFEHLWNTSLTLTQKQQITSMVFNKGALGITDLGYMLEAIDPKHRYGLANSINTWYQTPNTKDTPFFQWLGDKSVLGSVDYFSESQRKNYQVKVGRTVRKANGENLVGENIFIMTDKRQFYSAQKETGKLHHSSFLGGQKVAGAGELITDSGGKLLKVTDYSGHYKPSVEAIKSVLQALGAAGVDLNVLIVEEKGKNKETKAADYLKL